MPKTYVKTVFRTLREAIANEMKEPGLRQTYKANIAMCIYDNRRKDGRLNIKECNMVADKLINLIFY